MFDRNGPLKTATALLPVVLVAACSVLPGEEEEQERSLVVGTTSAPTSLDPAGAWDGSWELYRNIYQTLLTVPNAGSSPEPDAAKSCGFSDPQSKVYRCTLRAGLKFSSGEPLDAEAVKYSLDRLNTVNAKAGPAPLLAGLARVETKGDRTVIFRLRKSDATFPFLLSTPAAALVEPRSYPASSLRMGEDVVGSGPYTLDDYAAEKKAVLTKNPDYKGMAQVKNDSVTIRYYSRSSAMVKDLKAGRIDLTYRGLAPSQIRGMEAGGGGGGGADDLDLHEMVGTEIHYLVFNPKDGEVRNPAVRRAVAQLVDRKELLRRVYDRTADPLYSLVPSGIAGHSNAFFDVYGEPDKKKAESILTKAGITKKVHLTFWYADDRYGEATKQEFKEIKRQLEDSGLFEIEVKSRGWDTFQKGYLEGEYPVFGRGWSADFPDADNYIAPFVGEKNAVGTPYDNPELSEKLLPLSRKQSDRGVASESFARAQKIIAQDVRLLPLWQGRVYIASHRDIAGIEWALDPSVIMRMWELHKKASW